MLLMTYVGNLVALVNLSCTGCLGDSREITQCANVTCSNRRPPAGNCRLVLPPGACCHVCGNYLKIDASLLNYELMFDVRIGIK